MESTDQKEINIEQAASQLRLLNGEIGKNHLHGGPHDQPWRESLRSLTEQEWHEICLYIRRFEFPVNLLAGPYGFIVVIHDHHDIPILCKPEALLVIENDQLPMAVAHPGFTGQPALLALLESYTHSPRNQDLLSFYGFEPLNDVQSYAY